MKTPDHADTTVINELFEKYVEPMKLKPAPKLNAETLLSGRTNEIDLKRFPGLKPEYDEVPTGFACWDGNSYDGPGCPIGYGPTPQCALLNLLEQL